MSAQELRRDLRDVWLIVAYPNMKPTETLQNLIDNFVFATEEMAKEEAQNALEQDHSTFWGFTVQRRSLVTQREAILKMSAFQEKLKQALSRERGTTMTTETLAGFYADYFKSGKTFADWFKEWSADL
jgi:hypothetical protein